MYICLDIETTGLDPENDKIIEIAIVRFDKENIIEKWSSLVNPGFPIPPTVTHITGITDKDMENAPQWEKIQAKVQSLIQHEPIVGHNINFDISFLIKSGITVTNPQIDTYDLSRILLQREASYSLEILCKKYKISQKQTHRALDDVLANIKLLQIFEQQIAEIHPDLMAQICYLLQRSEWQGKIVFEKILKKKLKKPEFKIKFRASTRAASKAKKPKLSKAADYLEKSKNILKIIPDYSERESQIKMTNAVEEALQKNKGLLCEAGTGTGKSLAYLIPSALFAIKNNEKIVISTHTKNLQDQLEKKDIPLLQKILNRDADISVATLKGRKNYLSITRLRKFVQKSHFQSHETTMLLKVLLWLEHTVSGDLEEIDLHGKEKFAWGDVCCDEHYCFHDDPKNSCFCAYARARAADASLIIVNHALLLTDTVTKNPLIPASTYLVVDEAHNLEDDATNIYSIELRKNDFDYPISSLIKTLRGIDVPHNKAENLQSKIDIFFGLLGIFYEKASDYTLSQNEDSYSEYAPQILLEGAFEQTLEWKKIENAEKILTLLYDEIKQELKEIENPDLGASLKKLDQKFAELNLVITEKKNRIRYVFAYQDGTLILKSAPLEVAEILQETLFSKKHSVILTSATLSIADSRGEKNCDYIRNQLGLKDDFAEMILPSPFDYQKQVKILIPSDIPSQGNVGHFEAYTNVIANVVKHYGGRTLVLFTSKKAIEAAYGKLAIPLKELGINVLAQNISGGRGKILAFFEENPANSVIFGTASFWEGIDLKGDMLKCVMIHKLPFDAYKDPIIQKRCELSRNYFDDYYVPRAILKLKQGFGRLIRCEKDSGTIIILDTRVITKNYGQRFLQSLPEKTPVITAPSSKILDLLKIQL